MSSATYEQLLREALVDLSDMQEVDKKSVGLKYGAKKAEDRAYMIQHWSSLYVRYVQVARKLCEVHDQILQPQKRLDVRILLDSTLGRMLEMKHKMVELCGEYINFDDVLVDLKLTPQQFEIPIPTYFIQEREEQLKMWNEVIAASARRDLEAPTAPKPNDVPEVPMTLERAIEIIQCNERGRQGRQKAKFHKDVRDQSQAQRRDYEYEQHQDEDRAAFTITRMMKGYLVRKQYQKQRREQLEFLGMEMSNSIASNASLEKLKSKLRIRKDKQKGNEADLGQRAKEMRAKIKVQEGGRIMEEMLDEILMHMANLRLNADGEMPQFPTEEEGGSLALLNMRPGQLSPEEEAKKKDEEAAAAASSKKAPEKEKKKSDKELEEESLPTIEASKFWVRVENVRKRYMDTWQKHFHDTYLNDKDFDQEYDKTLLRTEIMEGAGGVISELRKCVDQLVMVEVANLTERIARETMAKRKKQKAKKPPKKKAVKDPSEGKPMDYHTKWLADFGAVQLPERVHLDDYVGSANLLGSVVDDEERQLQQQQDETKKKWEKLLENWNDYVEQSLRMTKDQFQLLFENYYQASWNFEPSMQQVRHQVAEYCVLPLGSQVVHDLAPNCKSVLFYGAPKSGKTMLTHAVCTEAGANLFCLTPAVINQEGVPLQKLVQTVFRIARALAPSVIYLDEVEKVFMGGKGKKKKGGPDPGKSNKIKKDLQKQMLELTPTDRVVVIGNSSCPWEADQKDFKAFFERYVYVVHPDYASRLLLWQNRCEHKSVVLKEEDYEVLAYMTSKYTSGTICQIINDTLTDRRIKRIKSKDVTADEFLPAMSRAKPIFKEDYEKTKEFSQSLDFRCRKPIFPTDFIQEETEEDKKKKKAPAKKK